MECKRRLFHTVSLLSISDTVRYYEGLARKGWILTESGWLFEKFRVGEPQNLYYSIVPKAPGIPAGIKNLENWEYVTENRNYTVYSSTNDIEKIRFSLELSTNRMLEGIIVLLLLPVLIYVDLRAPLPHDSAAFLGLMLSVYYVMYCAAFVMHAAEAVHINRTGRFFGDNRTRFGICLLIDYVYLCFRAVFGVFLVWFVLRIAV